jgi:hypothetical protein
MSSRPRRLATRSLLASVLMICVTLATACAPPPSPLVRAFGDNKHWIVAEEMDYTIGSTDDMIAVPAGFVTDFASIPQPLWSLGLSPQGRYSRAAVIHDYLYWSQACTREQSDRLMVIAMKESDVGRFDEAIVYQGVKNGGASAWRENAREREAGLPRVVPPELREPEDPNMDWPTYRALLIEQGVEDPPFPRDQAFCAYGDSTEVP